MPEQDNRPAVYLEGNTVIYRASALGHCLRMLWAARSGLEPKPFPTVIQTAMDEGTELESTILNLLHDEYHWGFAYAGQQFQVELNVGAFNGLTLIVRGKVDEIRDDGLPVDVKAFSQSTINNPLPDYYNWQQSIYAIGMGKDRYYMPIYNKSTGRIEPTSLPALIPKYTREHIRDRVLQVEEAFHSGIMPESCPADYGCQYYYLHDKPVPGILPEDSIVLLAARINLSRKIDTLSKAKATLDEAIRPKLEQGVSYNLIAEDNASYSITVIANPSKFNTKAAQALLTDAGIDWKNDPDFQIPGVGTQLRVTKPKPRKAKDENQ